MEVMTTELMYFLYEEHNNLWPLSEQTTHPLLLQHLILEQLTISTATNTRWLL